MTNEEYLEKEIYTIDGQIVGTSLSIIALIIAVLLLINLRKRMLNEDPFFTIEESQTIVLANKIFIFLISLWFLYITYKGYELAKESGQETKNFELQVLVAAVSLILAGIAIYVVINSNRTPGFDPAEYENPQA